MAPPKSVYKYCRECNNLLYPKADVHRRILLRACRNCQYEEEADAALVYRNDLLTITKEQPGVIQDIETDPTLPRRSEVPCPHCHHPEAVFYQDQSKRHETRMTVFLVCTSCKKIFTDPRVGSVVRPAGA
ncbi:dna-directed rna polymerase ii subunit i [Phaffia rhodozyma]|uniref:DNA-directed RNA polymerase subunit n=1 Tax=Phaffia rhodozyma TaxID=264483 RepID=A0A0F7SRL9_PHARH|nr:dna-directed rna polymerase ii subunit i [Phaffia rhodozyma]